MAPLTDAERGEKAKELMRESEANAWMFTRHQSQVVSWVHPSAGALPPNVNDLELTAQRVTDLEQEQNRLCREAYVLCRGAEFSVQFEGHSDTVFQALASTQSSLAQLISKATPASGPSASTQQQQPSAAKLKALEPPEFSGKFEEWRAFHDLFQAMIHTRSNLSGSEKLVYLQAALKKGSASCIISSYEPTDANYAEAWAHLKLRYEVKREIVFSHLRVFEEHKPVPQDNDRGLRSLADSLNKCAPSSRKECQ